MLQTLSNLYVHSIFHIKNSCILIRKVDQSRLYSYIGSFIKENGFNPVPINIICIFYDGYLYGSGSRTRGWFCLDFTTGAQRWEAGNDEGCITFADSMLYTLDQRGTMRLVRTTPEK